MHGMVQGMTRLSTKLSVIHGTVHILAMAKQGWADFKITRSLETHCEGAAGCIWHIKFPSDDEPGV